MKKVLKKYQWGLTPMVSFFAGVEHEPDAADDEGDAQELTHVKGHALLKIHLDLLAELNEESEREDEQNAQSEEEPRAHALGLVAVERPANEKEQDVGQRLIQLSGVAR
jgi:hypothetical protein